MQTEKNLLQKLLNLNINKINKKFEADYLKSVSKKIKKL